MFLSLINRKCGTRKRFRLYLDIFSKCRNPKANWQMVMQNEGWHYHWPAITQSKNSDCWKAGKTRGTKSRLISVLLLIFWQSYTRVKLCKTRTNPDYLRHSLAIGLRSKSSGLEARLYMCVESVVIACVVCTIWTCRYSYNAQYK